MTPLTRRQIALVAILAVAVVVVLILEPWSDPQAETGLRPSNRPGQGDGKVPDAPVVDLRLERLHGERDELPEADRNPFRFRPKAPPPAPPRAAGSLPAPRPPEFLPPPVPAQPAGPPPPPPIAVKFFGVLTIGGERVAVFTDTRGNQFHGKQGDIIEGRYRVLRIGPDSVDLAYLDGRGRQTIGLTGQ
jgi:hypothetical protein